MNLIAQILSILDEDEGRGKRYDFVFAHGKKSYKGKAYLIPTLVNFKQRSIIRIDLQEEI